MSHYSVFAISENKPTADSWVPSDEDLANSLEHFDYFKEIPKDLNNIRENLESCLYGYESVSYAVEKGEDGAPDSVKVTIGKGSIRKMVESRLETWKELCAKVTPVEFAFRDGNAFWAYCMLSRTVGKPYVVDTTNDDECYDPLQEWLFNRIERNDSADTVFFVYAEYDAHY